MKRKLYRGPCVYTATPPTLLLTFDFELAWGAFDKRFGPRLLDAAKWTHDVGVPMILQWLSEHGISATWATVGACMLDHLPAVADLAEVRYQHFRKPWFSLVPPGSSEHSAPEWFGASLIRQIQTTTPHQEIAFHSFSHVLFGHPGTSRERAQQELNTCAQIAHELGISPLSFVFPRNSIAHLDLLRAAGFTCYRAEDNLTFGPYRIIGLGRCMSVIADLAGITPRVVEPQVLAGLVAIPGSLMIRSATGWRRIIPKGSRLRRLLRGLDRVCAEGGVLSVWLHPEQLFQQQSLHDTLLSFMTEARRRIHMGQLRCATMGQLSEEFSRKTVATPRETVPAT